jgi:hypothetical protein
MDKALHLEQIEDLVHSALRQLSRPIVFGANGFNQLSGGSCSVKEPIFHQIS